MGGENQNSLIGGTIACAVAFLVTSYIAGSEALFALAGREATGTVTEAAEYQKRGKFGTKRGSRYEVEYTFTDHKGRVRTGKDTVSSSKFGDALDGTVPVLYRPGVAGGSSRVSGSPQLIGVGVFVGSGLGLMGLLGWMWFQGREEARGAKKKKRKKLRAEVRDEEDDVVARRHL